MHTVDLIILAIISISAVVGVFRGFFPELLSLGTWIVAAWAGWKYASLVEPLIAGKLGSVVVELWAARLIIFVAVLIIGGLLGQVVAILIEKSGLTGTNRALGLVFGVVRGIVIVGVLVLFARMLGFERESWWDQAQLIGFGEAVADWISALLPDDIADRVLPDAPGEAAPAPGRRFDLCRRQWFYGESGVRQP